MYELRNTVGAFWVYVYELSETVCALWVCVYELRDTFGTAWVFECVSLEEREREKQQVTRLQVQQGVPQISFQINWILYDLYWIIFFDWMVNWNDGQNRVTESFSHWSWKIFSRNSVFMYLWRFCLFLFHQHCMHGGIISLEDYFPHINVIPKCLCKFYSFRLSFLRVWRTSL